MNRKRVVILGATGSIGESALKVARDIPERMEIVGLAAKSNAQKLAAAANEVRPESVCLVDETQLDVLRKALDYEPRIFSGEAGLVEIACLTNADMVLVAIVGTGGLRPALAAISLCLAQPVRRAPARRLSAASQMDRMTSPAGRMAFTMPALCP